MNKVYKFLKFLCIFFLSLVGLDLIIVIFFSVYRPPIQKADAIVVLGAAINTEAAYNRSLEGLKLYQQGLAPVIILSGGQDYKGAMTEAKYMELIIESESNQPIPLIIEDQSHSTYDNIKNTKAELGGKAGSIIIVSDSFHLARATLMAKREGFGPIYTSSPDTKDFNLKDLLYYYAREFFAMMDYLPKFIFG